MHLLDLAGGKRAGGADKRCVLEEVREPVVGANLAAPEDQHCADVSRFVGNDVHAKAIAERQ
jgi:hypothetical protein